MNSEDSVASACSCSSSETHNYENPLRSHALLQVIAFARVFGAAAHGHQLAKFDQP